MSTQKVWTDKEVDYLINYWGSKTLYSISKKLKRSQSSVNQKAKQLELGSWKLSSEFITINELAKYFKTSSQTVYYTWCMNNGLKYKQEPLSDKRFLTMISLEIFWKWAEQHRELIHAERLEENILGLEPKWLKEKRKEDVKKPYQHYWTKAEEDRLIYNLSKFCFTYDDLCKKYGVSYKQMNKKINQLGTNYRPINPNAGRSKWNDEIEKELIRLILSGKGRKEICEKLNMSKSSIETKLISLCGTSSFEKIRVGKNTISILNCDKVV